MNRFFRNLILTAAAALLSMNMTAAEVDTDAARAQAAEFMAGFAGGKLTTAVPTLRLDHVERSARQPGMADYYVFNTSDDAAFVIVSGDDRTVPILGYGNGSLDMSRIPDNLRWWLDGYKRQLEWLRDNHDEVNSSIASRSAESDDITVAPMLTCQWDQGAPYDWQCAVYDGQYCLTGCVATAMAQVMHYWKYPDVLPALSAYTSVTLNIPIEALPPVELDWENMLDVYRAGYYNETQSTAVATLMRYCSQACFTDCSPGGSASSGFDQIFSLKMFGYNHTARCLYRDQFSPEVWRGMVNEELLAGRPIPYGGHDDFGGHAFVIDGCGDGKYHVNWGWGGYCNGYFELDLLDPYPGCEFKYNQDMGYHVFPDDGSTEDVPLRYDFEMDGIYYKIVGNEAMVTSRDECYASYHGDVEIPQEVAFQGVTYRVTAIDDMAFLGSTDLTSIKLPYIETIGMVAFLRCTGMHEVTLGKQLKTSGPYAFDNVLALERVNIEDLDAWVSVDFLSYTSNPLYYARRLCCGGQEVTDLVVSGDAKAVKQFAFPLCGSLKSVTIGNGATSIGEGAFYGCPNLEKVTVQGDMHQVGYCAFYDCTRLSDLEFNGKVGKIDDYAFTGCGIQGELRLPSSVDTIGYAAFADANGVKRLVVHDVGFVDSYAFCDCRGLESVSFNGLVGTMGDKVFDECTSLSRVEVSDLALWCGYGFTSANSNPLSLAGHLYVNDQEVSRLVIPAGVTRINDYVFQGCQSLSSAVIGNDVTSIGNQAFVRCKNLTKVKVGDGVKRIGKQAFSICTSLKHVALGRGIDSIDYKAFNSSMVIESIVCRGETPPVLADKACFSQTVYKNAALIVPCGSLDAYRNEAYWSQFVKGVNLGDFNDDDEIDIVDVNILISAILSGDENPVYDVNCDYEVNIIDVDAVINIILKE